MQLEVKVTKLYIGVCSIIFFLKKFYEFFFQNMINLMSLRPTKISWKPLVEKDSVAFVALILLKEILTTLSMILLEMIPVTKMTMISQASFRTEIKSIQEVKLFIC